MKAIPYYIYTLSLAVLTLASCTDQYEYTPVATDNHGIFLQAERTEYFYADDENDTIVFMVLRHDSTEAATYSLEVSDQTLGIPTSLHFQAGQRCDTVRVPYTLATNSIDMPVDITVSQPDAYTYGQSRLTLSMSHAQSIGHGVLSSTLFGYVNGVPIDYDCPLCAFDVQRTDTTAVATYLVRKMYDPRYNVRFTIDQDNNARIATQPCFQDEEGYIYDATATGTYDPDKRQLTLLVSMSVSGALVTIGEEKITFPTGYDPRP